MLFQSPPAVGKFPDYLDPPWELKFSVPDITACFNKSTIIFLPCSNLELPSQNCQTSPWRIGTVTEHQLTQESKMKPMVSPFMKILIVFYSKICVPMPGASPENVRKAVYFQVLWQNPLLYIIRTVSYFLLCKKKKKILGHMQQLSQS